MRDAVALAGALEEGGDDVEAILRGYERTRRRTADAFQRAAKRSIAWYEALAARDLGDTTRFALEYVMRTGRVRYEEFRRLNPEIVGAYERPQDVSALLEAAS
jgi:2-polyprenyl-6-methoxyphenol hydroxylase-like FAD-dependent oxidoreductase